MAKPWFEKRITTANLNGQRQRAEYEAPTKYGGFATSAMGAQSLGHPLIKMRAYRDALQSIARALQSPSAQPTTPRHKTADEILRAAKPPAGHAVQ